MKKIILRTGLITIGSLALFSKDLTLSKAYSSDTLLETENSDYMSNTENLIKKFSNIYIVDENIVLNKFRELTLNFSNYNWKHDYAIYDYKYENEELAILSIVRDISKNPEKYDLTLEELKVNCEYETTDYYEDLLSHYSELIGVNKEVALSISYAECGSNLDSSNFLNNHNPAGLGPYNYYDNIEQGVIEYVYFLKNTCNCSIDSDQSFFYKIGPSYCTIGTENWISMTTSFYNNIIDDYYIYAYNRGYQKVLK